MNEYNGNDSPQIDFPISYIDLFCGIGAFRIAMRNVCSERGVPSMCSFSCDIDKECQKSYQTNFGDLPAGDITKIPAHVIPDHDFLLAGFPCQPFSICGDMKGFEDTRGTLFFDIARILKEKQPSAFLLENVKLLVGHNKGRTLNRIRQTIDELGYNHDFRVLNALHFGLPHKRERIFIVGFKKSCMFEWPQGGMPMKQLSEVLEKNVPNKFYASEYIRKNRLDKHSPTNDITIWHENKGGHISSYPYSCALRAGASYNYLLVNGERRLTPREMLRLQGFPDSYQIVCNDYQTRKQAGNSAPVPVIEEILRRMFDALGIKNPTTISSHINYSNFDLQEERVTL